MNNSKLDNNKQHNISNRHHILAIISPQKSIPEKYKGLFCGNTVNMYKLINKHLNPPINQRDIFDTVEQVLTKQLQLVNDAFFKISSLQSSLLNIGTIGYACETPIDFYLFVISYEYSMPGSV